MMVAIVIDNLPNDKYEARIDMNGRKTVLIELLEEAVEHNYTLDNLISTMESKLEEIKEAM